MDIGLLLMLINFYRTAREGATLAQEPSESTVWEPSPSVRAGVKGGWIERPSTVFLVAGLCFFFLAIFVQGIIPWLTPATRTATVTDAATGKPIQVADYTPQQLHGRAVYIREGCWYCHSQYVRPVTGESFRWGPVSQAGEYAYDLPHLFGTRRIGPDLTRVGLKYGSDWHVAHHWDPRHVVPDSIMPSFPWLFEPAQGNAPPRMSEDGLALVSYLQRLGTGIGDWRETFIPTRVASGVSLTIDPREREQLVSEGKDVYERRCIGCHGENGDGKGPSAVFLDPKPRDFTKGIFKFRSTSGKDSLPTDADLFITVTHGLWGTAMPTWQEIPARERMAVIQYIKTFSDRWRKETVGQPIDVPAEPPVTEASIDNGKELFHGKAACFICHGPEGRGDGLLAATLKDVWGHPERPADFTLPAGARGGVKLGHDGVHIFKTIMTGVGGTPMPDFEQQLTHVDVSKQNGCAVPQNQLTPMGIWDLVHYVQSLRIEAHAGELVAAGLKSSDRRASLSNLWASLSEAAVTGHLGSGVIQTELAQLNQLNTHQLKIANGPVLTGAGGRS
jgi:cbb3-type cytochrome oxidase cytochrome c subunit/cytochrome c553